MSEWQESSGSSTPSSLPASTGQEGPEASRTETVYLDAGGVTVTQARLILEGRAYPLSETSSILVDEVRDRNLVWGSCGGTIAGMLFCVWLAALFPTLLGTLVCVALGALVLGAGVTLARREKPTYRLILRGTAGETEVFSSRDWRRIREIVTAVNRAAAESADSSVAAPEPDRGP